MNEVLLVPATEEHVRAFAPLLRPEDLAELEASGVTDPLEAMLDWCAGDVLTLAAVYRGEVGAIIGVHDAGEMWVLTGRSFPRYPVAFLRAARRAIAMMHELFPVLWNAIDGRYTGALCLAASLGATFSWPVPVGPARSPFIPFAIRRA